jgi:integrase
MATKKFRRFTDSTVQAIADFKDDADHGAPLIRGTFWDAEIKGLRLRVGARTMTWDYFRQRRQRGTRRAVCQVIGHWPAVNVAQARQAALMIGGHVAEQIAAKRPLPGKQSAVKFSDAFTAYCEYLEQRAADKGKPPRWKRNVEQLGKQLILPEWKKWSLADMANNPLAVQSWHRKITKNAGPVSANRCCQIIRAMYKRATRTDLSLPKADNPTNGVDFNSETAAEKGLTFKDFPKWADAWRKLPPTRRAYHLFCLLSGCRPGEAARLHWSDIRPQSRTLVISKAKAGSDIEIPLSIPIVRALKMARAACSSRKENALVFPECGQAGHRDPLPARGHELRHTYETIARDLKIDDFLCHFLLGHVPRNISEGYVARAMLMAGEGMREAQRRISRRIVSLLGLADTVSVGI